MEKNLKKVLYVLLAFGLLLVADYLVIKPLFKTKEDELLNTKTKEATIIESTLVNSQKLYNKYELNQGDISKKSQEWFQTNIKSDIAIKFQYSNKNADISKFNIYVNDIKIENEEEFYNYDKFKINFHLYEDTLVIEHIRSYNHVPFIKIIDLKNGSIRNLASAEDFYVNNVIVDEYGITASYSRLSSPVEYYLEKEDTNLVFKIPNDEVSINICDKKTWSDTLRNLDYVSFDMNYANKDDKIDFNAPTITNMKKLDEYLKSYTKEFNEICKNNN